MFAVLWRFFFTQLFHVILHQELIRNSTEPSSPKDVEGKDVVDEADTYTMMDLLSDDEFAADDWLTSLGLEPAALDTRG